MAIPTTVVIDKGLERAAKLIMDDINYIAVGTGTTTPTALDTALVTETVRVVTTKTLQQGKSIQARGFFTNSNLPSTMEEIGWFMNGGSGSGTGELVTRALSNFVKNNQDMLVIVELTLKEIE